jgi:hypothetical protein
MSRTLVATGVAVMVLCTPLFLFADTADANGGVEEAIQAYFPHVPVMMEIARCESRLRQFYGPELPLAGGTGGNMIGLFQINAPVHFELAQELGMNIYTLEGNIAYAKLLYENEGTRPWRSSQKCWSEAAEEIARLQKLIAELTVQLEALIAQKLALG